MAVRAFAIALVLLALAAPVSAQGLGDAASKERQKRKAGGPPQEPRVYDDSDLRKGKPAGSKDEGTKNDAPRQEPADASDSSADAAAAARGRVKQAEDGVAAAEAAVSKIEARVKELQDKLNPMSPSFIYGAAAASDAPGDEMRAKEELARLPGELATAKAGVEAARKALDDVRSGRRPGG